MFLGWYDPDRKRTPKQKVQAACDRYAEKFGHNAAAVMMNPAHEADLQGINLAVHGRFYIALNTFYVGHDLIEPATDKETAI